MIRCCVLAIIVALFMSSVEVSCFSLKVQRSCCRNVLNSPISRNEYNHRNPRVSFYALSMVKDKKNGPKDSGAAKQKKTKKVDSVSPSAPQKQVKTLNAVSVAPKVNLKVSEDILVDEAGRSKAKLEDFRSFYSSSTPAGSEINLETFKSYGPVKKLLQESLVEGHM
jgi:hypothetical protein